ncbi:MAG: peptidylprolyl isomerase [Gemmatimonadales bacterium]
MLRTRLPGTVPGTVLVLLATLVTGRLAAQQPPRQAPATQASSREFPVDRVMAVVGQRPILMSEMLEYINAQRGAGMEVPADSAGYTALMKTVMDRLIDDEVLVGAAKQYKIEATDAEVQVTVDKFMKQVKGTFKTDAEFRAALKSAGFGNENEFRKFRVEQDKRDLLMKRSMDSLQAHGRMSAPVSVSEDEITAAFAKAKDKIGKRPATISFKQIVVPPRANPVSRRIAIAKAESLLVEINKKGSDFEKIAKRETMDPSTKEVGGDLGWNRLGQMVPAFDRAMFSLRPGEVSGVVETPYGFHIIKVDRVQPKEVKARHILIMPTLDSADVTRAHLVADTVLRLWRAKSLTYDSLAARYHDDSELKGFPDGYPVDSLPAEYKKAIEGVKAGEYTAPFEIPNTRTGFAKVGIVLITDRVEGGDYTVADLRDRIRQQLQQERQARRMLDQLRKEQSVIIRP